MRRQYLLITLLVVFEVSGFEFFAGCGDSSAPTLNGPSIVPIAVSFAPYSTTVQIGGVQQFSASVSPNATSQSVVWSVSGTGCSGAACGNIDGTGKYTAPATVPDPAAVTVTARSVVDSTRFAAVTIAIVAVAGASFSFSVSPSGIAFGNQMVNTISAPKAATLTNTGSTPQPVSARMNGLNFADFTQTNDCP